MFFISWGSTITHTDDELPYSANHSRWKTLGFCGLAIYCEVFLQIYDVAVFVVILRCSTNGTTAEVFHYGLYGTHCDDNNNNQIVIYLVYNNNHDR